MSHHGSRPPSKSPKRKWVSNRDKSAEPVAKPPSPSRYWRCSKCSYAWSWINKSACYSCGASRVEAAEANVNGNMEGPSEGNNQRRERGSGAQRDKTLEQLVAPVQELAKRTGIELEAPDEESDADITMTEDVKETHRKAIKALQAAVAQLDGDDAQKDLKTELLCKIQVHKEALSSMKPIGTRILQLESAIEKKQGYIDVANQQIRNYQKLVESWTANIVEMNETVVSLKRRRAELDVGMAQDTQQLDQLQKDHFSTQQALCALVRAIQNCDQGSLQECLGSVQQMSGIQQLLAAPVTPNGNGLVSPSEAMPRHYTTPSSRVRISTTPESSPPSTPPKKTTGRRLRSPSPGRGRPSCSGSDQAASGVSTATTATPGSAQTDLYGLLKNISAADASLMEAVQEDQEPTNQQLQDGKDLPVPP